MGSILMHLCISDKIRKKYNFGDQFMVGSVLPDILKRTKMSRDDSHYIMRFVEDGYVYRLPDLNKYIEEHRDNIKTDELTIGYFAHLVEDYVWFKYISGLFTKVREDEEEKDVIRFRSDNFSIPHPGEEYGIEMYQDYHNMNPWLYKKLDIDIDDFIKKVVDYTQDENAAIILNEAMNLNIICRDGKNAYLDENCIERYIKASEELFELNWNRINSDTDIASILGFSESNWKY